MYVQHIYLKDLIYWTYDQTVTFEVRLDKFRGLNFYG